MATWHIYRCNNCDYEANVSGCSDALFSGYTETMVCLFCKELDDYVVLTPENKIITNFTCEECGKNDIVGWNYKTKPCPKCTTGKMKKDMNGGITHAD